MASYRVELAPQAIEDIAETRAYIAGELGSPAAAERFVGDMLEAVSGLERLPLRNRRLATLPDGRELRRVRSGNFLALYVVAGEVVSVLTVVYGRADLERRISQLF